MPGNIDQANADQEDDRCQHRLGQVRQGARQEQEARAARHRGGQLGQLAAAAGAVDRLRLGRATVHHERARAPGRDIGQRRRPGRHSRRTTPPRTGGVGARGGGALGQDHHEHGDRGSGQQLRDVVQLTGRRPMVGRPPGTGPRGTRPYAARLNASARHDSADDREQCAGNLFFAHPPQADDHDQRDRDDEGRDIGLANLRQGDQRLVRSSRTPPARPASRRAGRLPPECRRQSEPDQDRPRQEVGQERQAEQAR